RPGSLHTLPVARGGGVVASSQTTDMGALSATAALLFPRGARPTAAAVRALALASGNFAITFDSAERAGEDRQTERWVEILANGRTCDLLGVMPGPAATRPPCAHVFGLADDSAAERLEAMVLRPGPHLVGGAGAMPVIRQLALVAAQLAELPGIKAVAWPAARIWNGVQHFRDVVLRWSEGGVFPGFGLVALASM